MRWRKRKEENSGNSSDLPTDPNVLMERLAHLNTLLNDIDNEISRLSEEKFAGTLHDGEYNIQTSYLSQSAVPLKKERVEILKQIDAMRRNMGRTALEE